MPISTPETFLFVSILFYALVSILVSMYGIAGIPQVSGLSNVVCTSDSGFLGFLTTLPGCVFGIVSVFTQFLLIPIALIANPLTSWLGALMTALGIVDIFILVRMIRGSG